LKVTISGKDAEVRVYDLWPSAGGQDCAAIGYFTTSLAALEHMCGQGHSPNHAERGSMGSKFGIARAQIEYRPLAV
jgi:hypothetical protein